MRQEPMKIVGFSASPRPQGSTAWVVGTILEGAIDRGAQVRFWSTAGLDLRPCRACYACKTKDRSCSCPDAFATGTGCINLVLKGHGFSRAMMGAGCPILRFFLAKGGIASPPTNPRQNWKLTAES